MAARGWIVRGEADATSPGAAGDAPLIDPRLRVLDPALATGLCIHGLYVVASEPIGASWAVLLAVVGVAAASGFVPQGGTTPAVARAILLCVVATAFAAVHGGPLSPFAWWYHAIVVVYGLVFSARVGMGITVIACSCFVSLLGTPAPGPPAAVLGRLTLLVALGWMGWRVASVYGAAIASNRRMALSDPLTGLPNRTLLLDRVAHAQARAQRSDAGPAVLLLDLDGFKLINDTFGHHAGDELLRAVARRLRQAVRPADTVARLGGDEFVVLCEDLGDARDVTAVAQRICDRLGRPVVLEGREVSVGVSVGIAVHEGTPRSPADLLSQADVAMYRAKQRGTECYELFDPAMRVDAEGRLTLQAALRQALARDEFRLVYQPQVRLTDDLVVGHEALLRWHPHGESVLAPAAFMAEAEQSGLIVPIGEWVLFEACRQGARWRADGACGGVAVNVSARQFTTGDLSRTVERALDAAGADPDLLRLEITESAAMVDQDRAVATLAELREMGVEVHIDDFGTGYTSFSRLRRFPVDALKLDRSFISEVPEGPGAWAIPTAMVVLAHSLGLTAIAEGVETPTQLEAVRRMGCDVAQGYYLGMPEPPAGERDVQRPSLSATAEQPHLMKVLEKLREERGPR